MVALDGVDAPGLVRRRDARRERRRGGRAVSAAAVRRAGYRARRCAPTDRACTPFWRRDARASPRSCRWCCWPRRRADAGGPRRAIAEPLYLLSMAVGGWPIARAALVALRRRSLDMNVLMALAAVGAVGIGAYAEGAWVLVLFAVGTTLETYALDRSRRSVMRCSSCRPRRRACRRGRQERLVDVDEVAVGARVRGASRRAPAARRRPSCPVPRASTSRRSPASPVPVDMASGRLGVRGFDQRITARWSCAPPRPPPTRRSSRVAALVEAGAGQRGPRPSASSTASRRVYTPLVFVAAVCCWWSRRCLRRRRRHLDSTARSRC